MKPIAEFDESDDALRFAKMKGADYTLCDGQHKPWGVGQKQIRLTNHNGAEPADYHYVDPDREDDDE